MRWPEGAPGEPDIWDDGLVDEGKDYAKEPPELTPGRLFLNARAEALEDAADALWAENTTEDGLNVVGWLRARARSEGAEA